MNFNEIKKYANKMTKVRILCKCGHSIIVPPHLDKIICNWCGNYVFKNKKLEFEYRLKEAKNKKS